MRLKSIDLRGVTRFTQPVHVDLDALGPGLIAIVGDNGAGKTTLIEAVAGALYKTLPSDESGWYAAFHGRDAYIEVPFEDDEGHEVKARVQVDAERQKTERYLIVDGVSTTTGRAKEADAEVPRRFGSYDLFLASVMGAQSRAGNFLDAAKGDRKARFAELLGLGALQARSERAREKAAQAAWALDQARGELARLEVILAARPQDEAALEKARVAQERAAGALALARDEETAATATLERARTAQERRQAAQAAVRAAERAVEDAKEALRQIEEARAAATRNAMQRREDLRAAEKQRARSRALVDEIPELKAAEVAIPALVEEEGRLALAAKVLIQAQAEQKLAEGAYAYQERRLEDAGEARERERQELARRAGLMEKVPCTSSVAWRPSEIPRGTAVNLAARCQLLADARQAKDRVQTMAEEQARPATIDPDFKAAMDRKLAADEALTAATLAVDPIRAEEVKEELLALRAKAARLPEAVQAGRDLKGAAGLADRTERAIAAELREALVVIDARHVDAKARLAEAEAELSNAPPWIEDAIPTVPQADTNLSRARERRIAAERDLRAADKEVSAAETAIARLDDLAQGLPARREDVRKNEEDLGDWKLLEKALGRDGIQAMEIAAAGPEVARLVNELLHACYGPRWSIAFETLREKRSAPGEFVEAFDIQVFDAGQERRVERISGGERVIVGEAIALALAIYNARKSGIAWKTLFRDETSGALSLANAQAYVDMLRRALALGGFHQLIFISHQPEVVARADARLIVAGGRVVVEGAAVAA